MNDDLLQSDGAALRERLLALEKRVDLSDRYTERALALATAEVSRRLDLLNGESDRLRHLQGTYVPRETCEVCMRDHDAKLDVITGDLREARGRLYWPMIVATGALLAAGAALIEAWLKKG